MGEENDGKITFFLLDGKVEGGGGWNEYKKMNGKSDCCFRYEIEFEFVQVTLKKIEEFFFHCLNFFTEPKVGNFITRSCTDSLHFLFTTLKF